MHSALPVPHSPSRSRACRPLRRRRPLQPGLPVYKREPSRPNEPPTGELGGAVGTLEAVNVVGLVEGRAAGLAVVDRLPAGTAGVCKKSACLRNCARWRWVRIAKAKGVPWNSIGLQPKYAGATLILGRLCEKSCTRVKVHLCTCCFEFAQAGRPVICPIPPFR